MNAFFTGRCAAIGIAAITTALFAQAATAPAFSQAVTTGVVSFSLNQSAQLNVLNLSAVPTTASAAASICTVQLEFRDSQNNLLKQLLVSNIPPGDSASLTLDRTEAPNPSVSRFAIRGVVRTGPLTPVTSNILPMPIANTCTVMPTLEIVNNATGDTQLVTSDTRSISPLVATPLAAH